MMKIVYIIDHLRLDGTQRMLSILIEGLADRGHQQAVLCLNYGWDPDLVEKIERSDVEVRFIDTLGLITGCGIISSLFWLRRNRFDVAIPMLFVSDVVGRALARAADIPRIVASIRARNVNYAKWKRWLVRFTMQWVDYTVFNSEVVKKFVVNEEGVKEDRAIVIHNGVRVSNYDNPVDKGRIVAELGLPQDVFIIGSIGRLDKQKGFDILLKAFSLLGRKDIHLLIIGRGKELSNLIRQSEALGIEQFVHFIGYRPDIPQLLAIMDLYIQPSRFEGMPNALLEAMASGCPIIASSVDGICELIQDGDHGWLVPPENEKALAEKVNRVLWNRRESQLIANAAKVRAAENFKIDIMVNAWEQILTKCIGPSK